MDSNRFNLFSKETITTSRIVWFVNIMLFLGVMYLGGTISGGLIHQEILKIPMFSSQLKIPPKYPFPKDSSKSKNDFKQILDQNIFGAKREEVLLPLSPPAEKDIISENRAPSPPPNSKLNIELRGTIVSASKSNSIAFIAKKNGTQEKIFGIDECFKPSDLEKDRECSSKSASILKIEEQKIMVAYLESKEWFDMEEEPKSKIENSENSEIAKKPIKPIKPKRISRTLKKVTSPKTVGKKNKSIPKKLDLQKIVETSEATEMNIQKEWVDEQLANFASILQDARVDAVTKNGKTYFQFKLIKSGSLYETLGFQKHDIIISVNNMIIDNLSKAMGLLQKLQSERELTIVIQRNNVRQTMKYFIN